MKDYICVDTCPVEEPCSQVGRPEYWPMAQAECTVFLAQLIRTIGDPPMGCYFKKRHNPHDFGTYLSIDLWYEDLDEENELHGALWEYLSKAENGLETWDDISKEELLKLQPDYFNAVKKMNGIEEPIVTEMNPSKKHLKIAM